MAALTDLILFFALYAFLGWLLEVIYAGIVDGKLTSRSFLRGPFCPIYGVGAIITLCIARIISSLYPAAYVLSLAITLGLVTIFSTILEYVVALIQERIFGIKLWDYSREAFNLQGRICLKYSLFWGGLAFLLLTVIHPFFKHYILQTPSNIKYAAAFLLIMYLSADFYFSVKGRI